MVSIVRAACVIVTVVCVAIPCLSATPSVPVNDINDIEGVQLVREVESASWGLNWTWKPVFSPSGHWVCLPTGGNEAPLRLLNAKTWEVEELGTVLPHPTERWEWLDEDKIAAKVRSGEIFVSISARQVSSSTSLLGLSAPKYLSRLQTRLQSRRDGLSVHKNGVVLKSWPTAKSVHNPVVSPSERYVSFRAYFPDYDEHPEKYPGRQGLFLWDRNSDELMMVADHISEEAAFSSDERWLLYAFQQLGMGGGITEEGTPDGSLWIMDLETGARKQLMPLEVFPIINLAWDGHDLFCLTRDPTTLSFYRLKLKAKNEQ